MEIIEKYQIIQSRSMTELTELVNKAIRSDWKPMGGVSVVLNTSPYSGEQHYIFFQSMVY